MIAVIIIVSSMIELVECNSSCRPSGLAWSKAYCLPGLFSHWESSTLPGNLRFVTYRHWYGSFGVWMSIKQKSMSMNRTKISVCTFTVTNVTQIWIIKKKMFDFPSDLNVLYCIVLYCIVEHGCLQLVLSSNWVILIVMVDSHQWSDSSSGKFAIF